MFAGWLATMLALWVEHIALKREPWRLGPPATYRIGVLTILAGYVLWAGLETAQRTLIEPWLAVVALVLIGPGAGVIVEILYWWDARKERQAAASTAAELTGMAKGLVKELRGHGTNDPQSRN